MRHGYTNRTELIDQQVIKTYRGPEAAARAVTERRALQTLSGVLPVPPVLGSSPSSLRVGFVPGRHGQELLDQGRAADVLRGCGEILRRLHAIPVRALFEDAAGVIVHGDFGPNNVLFATEPVAVVAVLDWELCHAGMPIEDLGWCEWIVRMHHPAAIAALTNLFDGYGWHPSWTERQSAMVDRCEWFQRFSRDWEPDGPGVALWSERAARTAAWRE